MRKLLVAFVGVAQRRRQVLLVSVSGNDAVSVISYRTMREVARVPVGDHPQRMRMGKIRRSYLR